MGAATAGKKGGGSKGKKQQPKKGQQQQRENNGGEKFWLCALVVGAVGAAAGAAVVLPQRLRTQAWRDGDCGAALLELPGSVKLFGGSQLAPACPAIVRGVVRRDEIWGPTKAWSLLVQEARPTMLSYDSISDLESGFTYWDNNTVLAAVSTRRQNFEVVKEHSCREFLERAKSDRVRFGGPASRVTTNRFGELARRRFEEQWSP
jgi:hypothetical protein